MYKNNEDIKVSIKKWKNGNEEAYAQVYEHYYRYVYYIAYQFFNNHEKAQDALQNAFLEAYHKIGTLKDINTFPAWIKKITYRKCLNMVTYDKKDALYYVNANDEDKQFDEKEPKNIPITVTKIQLDEAMNLVISRLSQLEEKKRVIGYLRFLEGYTAREIGELMNINTDTVGSHIKRIKMDLKGQLENANFTPKECLSILNVSSLVTVYQAHQNNKYGLLNSKKINKIPRKINIPNQWVNVVIKTCITATVIGGGTVAVITNKEEAKQYLNEVFEVSPIPQITSIDYNKEITNKAVELTVKATSNNYDQIYINENCTNSISENGAYSISIRKDNKIIDEKQMIITNIDTDSPWISKKEETNEKMILYVEDNYEVNFEEIRIYKNEQLLTSSDIDINNQMIVLNKEKDANYYLLVSDMVGNISEFHIECYSEI